MKKALGETTVKLGCKSKMEARELEEGLHVFKLTIETVCAERGEEWAFPAALLPKHVIQGAVDNRNMMLLLHGLPYKTLDLKAMPKETPELLRTVGWACFHDMPLPEWVGKGIYDAVVEGGLGADHLLRFDGGTHMAFDRRGDVLPVAMKFSYLDGGMDEGSYDMQKLAAHLLTRKDVCLYGWTDKWRRDRLERDAKPATSAEQAIFITSNGGGAFFTWMPSVEDYRKAWEKAKGYGDKYPSTEMRRAVFDLDLLGLRAAGAAKFNDFYERAESPSSEED